MKIGKSCVSCFAKQITKGVIAVKVARGKKGEGDVWARLIGAIPLKSGGMSLD